MQAVFAAAGQTAINVDGNYATGRLTFTGAIGLGTHTLSFDPANSGNTITVNGVMSGSGGITMGGAGDATINATTTLNFAGELRLSGGTLRITAATVLDLSGSPPLR